MSNDRKPSLRPERSAKVPRPVPVTPDEADPAGLADVPPPLVWERTATAAEDDGFDRETASVFGAVAALDVFCVTEASAKGPGRGLDALVRVADLVERVLEADGGGEVEFTHLFAPRLPFDVLLGEDARVTAADLFLERHGAGLPREAVRAVKALIRAEDAVARATWQGKRVTIEDLSTGRALPGPALFRRGSRPFVCRLVRVGRVHVPLAVERPVGRATAEALLVDVKNACVLAREVLAAGGVRLRSTKKGFGLGARLVAGPDDE